MALTATQVRAIAHPNTNWEGWRTWGGLQRVRWAFPGQERTVVPALLNSSSEFMSHRAQEQSKEFFYETEMKSDSV